MNCCCGDGREQGGEGIQPDPGCFGEYLSAVVAAVVAAVVVAHHDCLNSWVAGYIVAGPSSTTSSVILATFAAVAVAVVDADL